MFYFGLFAFLLNVYCVVFLFDNWSIMNILNACAAAWSGFMLLPEYQEEDDENDETA